MDGHEDCGLLESAAAELMGKATEMDEAPREKDVRDRDASAVMSW